MKWTPGRVSGNIEDRRGVRRAGVGGGLGIVGILVVLAISYFTGADPRALLQMVPQGGGAEEGQPIDPEVAANDPAVQFVSFVLDDAQNTWKRILPGYRDATLVLFREAVDSGCGFAQAATGPFYCPVDQKVYIDLSFFDELDRRFGAPGDFAQAYVLTHEIGHHVQTLMGTERQVRSAQQQDPSLENELSVRMELQADCYAGVWGHDTAQRDILSSGDVEEALNAAAAIGDDRLQKEATGRVQPESFTHGSSAQRVQWFRRGMEQGRVEACDTFGGR